MNRWRPMPLSVQLVSALRAGHRNLAPYEFWPNARGIAMLKPVSIATAVDYSDTFKLMMRYKHSGSTSDAPSNQRIEPPVLFFLCCMIDFQLVMRIALIEETHVLFTYIVPLCSSIAILGSGPCYSCCVCLSTGHILSGRIPRNFDVFFSV